MSVNQQTNLPIVTLDDKKKIVALNSEHETILSHIKEEIKHDKYNSIVTMENYKDMKSSATELNKTANYINKFKIQKVKDETKDIEDFKSNCKIYCDLIQQKREYILTGLDKFEEQTRQEVAKVCANYALTTMDMAKLKDEFRAVNLSDMTATKYMTAKGAISKQGKDEVEKRVNEKLALQNKVDNRLLNLENECLKAGIDPMSKEYIEGFIYEDDAAYEEKLTALIEVEKKRAEVQKARLEEEAKIKAENEAKEKVLAEQKALKDELHARYESDIKTADIPTLTRINLELRSYDSSATYELREMSRQKETELINKSTPFDDTEDKNKENHLREIANETKVEKKQEKEEAKNEVEVAQDGKVEKTLSIKIRVPATAADEQVKSAVIKMIKADRFPLENIEVS